MTKDYEIIHREVIYQGVFCFARYQLRYRLFNGGYSATVTRELLERSSAAAVLPYDPITDQVVLIEQFRPGAIHRGPHPWLLEIVAGVLSKNEKPEALAAREVQEEAGCEALDLYPICDYFVSPGGSDEYLHLYCARVNASQSGGLFGLAHENEDIRAYVLPVSEALAKLQAGEIKTGPAIISLQWLQLHREFLRNLWQKK